MTLLLGYPDRISVAGGEPIRFMVSCEGASAYRADLVRLVHGDAHPDGPGFREEEVPSSLTGEHPGRVQQIPIGSYVDVDDPTGLLDLPESLTLFTFVWSTLPGRGEQALLGRWGKGGYLLTLDAAGRVVFRVGKEGSADEVATDEPLAKRVWYAVAATLDASSGTAAVEAVPVVNSSSSLIGPIASPPAMSATGTIGQSPASGERFLLAACSRDEGAVTAHFNGKLDRPHVYARALDSDELSAIGRLDEPSPTAPVAAWDFSQGIGPAGIPSDRVADTSPNGLDGVCVNLPARAMTGVNWSGREHCFRHAPEEYGAIHFHEDDLEDACWEPDLELTIDPELPSGVYAARLRADGSEEHVPFCVRPPRGSASADVAMVLPTASYMAYMNDHQGMDADWAQLILAHTPVLSETDLLLNERRELGLSMYDSHRDGSGSCYSTRLRPLLTMRPRYLSPVASGPWGFVSDLYLIDWLTSTGSRFDVVTDEDLHHEGLELLSRYRCVLTGSHPEYTSHAMLDALEAYLMSGGRLMYLGGNGFYWVTEYHPEKPHAIEIRRGTAGIRTWEGEPGEGHLASTGGAGGLWRHHGRAPQKLFGVGFATEGMDESTYFRRLPDSQDPRAAFVFSGVEGETFGDHGLIHGGASGLELDRYDLSLGTPPETLLLGYSEGHTDQYLRVVEEIPVTRNGIGGTQDPGVRGDVVLFTTPGGGAVFSGSSIAWSASLSWNDYDNDVARITGNVLERFRAEAPLVWD